MHGVKSHPVLVVLLVLVILPSVGWPQSSDSHDGKAAARDTDQESDAQRAAIMKLIKSYVAAFNQGDAAGVAKHWANKGIYVNRTTGDRVVGRQAIETSLRELFADGPTGELSVEVEAIRFVTPDVAIEDGTARFGAETGPIDTTAYTAIYVREQNEWKLDSIREIASESTSTNYDVLSEWEWMVGSWTNELDEYRITTNCQWSADRNFLTRAFTVVRDEETQIQGMQIIGYDPTCDKVKCWVFHSGGGFGEGTIENDQILPASAVEGLQASDLGYHPIRRNTDGRWSIDTIGEHSLPVAAPGQQQLKELAWMVGQWVDQDEDATIRTACTWTPNQAFLRRSFQVDVKDRVDLAGLQVIGWDTGAGQIRSWVFDSAGGFANETWSQKSDRWVVESAGVLFGGQKSSTVRIITPIDKDSFTLEAIDREVGGQLLPDIGKMVVTRRKADH